MAAIARRWSSAACCVPRGRSWPGIAGCSRSPSAISDLSGWASTTTRRWHVSSKSWFVASRRVFRTDLPLSWLVTTVYSLLHAAADDVNTRRLKQSDAADVLEATLLPVLKGAQAAAHRGRS